MTGHFAEGMLSIKVVNSQAQTDGISHIREPYRCQILNNLINDFLYSVSELVRGTLKLTRNRYLKQPVPASVLALAEMPAE